MKHHHQTLVVAAAICLLAGCGEPNHAGPGKKPLLFANYYTWYVAGSGPHQIWTHWVRHPVADAMNLEAKRTGQVVQSLKPDEIASVLWPLAGLYDSDNPEVVRWHIRLAKAAGIDALLVDWWGPGGWQRVPGLTKSVFEDVVLPIAAEEGFKVALLDEPVQFRPLEESKQWVAEYLGKYKDHPAYLKIDGKPVYYIYQVAFDPSLTPEKFEELRAYVENRIGPVYWIVDAISNSNDDFRIPAQWRPAAGIDAFSFYGTFSIFREYGYKYLADRYARVVKQAHDAGKKMCLPVHPGHNNLRTGNPSHFEMPRNDGQTLRDYLQAATGAGADYVMVTSFNEWPESTVIEPSSSWKDPYQYLKILADWKGVKFRQPDEPACVKQADK